MAATKKATKKTATKKASTKRVTKKPAGIKLKDDTLYVVSVRTKLFTWKAAAVFETRADALTFKNHYENASPLTFAAAKIESVKLVQEQ